MEKIRINPVRENRYLHLAEKLNKADIATIGHYTEFGFMDPGIRSMNPRTEKFFGSAVTVRIPPQDSKAVHMAVSMANAGDVLVIDRGLDSTHACVGEMVALCAHVRQLSGIVVDGSITDINQILEIGIPVYARGIGALTTKFIGSCGEINEDISCGGVVVHPGDLIMADQNGVLVLRHFEAEYLVDTAIADQERENDEKREVLQGKTLQQLYIPEYPTNL
jgi:regulator of RNase E activity RraA